MSYALKYDNATADDVLKNLDTCIELISPDCISYYSKGMDFGTDVVDSRSISVDLDNSYSVLIQLLTNGLLRIVFKDSLYEEIYKINFTQLDYKNIFIFCNKNCFCMPGVMIHRMQDLYGEIFINYIFYSTLYNLNSVNLWRCIINNKGLEGLFIRIYNASGSDSLRGISSKLNIIMSDGLILVNGMGMYDNLVNNKPGAIYLLNDFKTGGRSYAILLYGCFVILDEE